MLQLCTQRHSVVLYYEGRRMKERIGRWGTGREEYESWGRRGRRRNWGGRSIVMGRRESGREEHRWRYTIK